MANEIVQEVGAATRAFASRELALGVAEREKSGEFAKSAFESFCGEGWADALTPEAEGGPGLGMKALVEIVIALAESDPGFAFAFAGHAALVEARSETSMTRVRLTADGWVAMPTVGDTVYTLADASEERVVAVHDARPHGLHSAATRDADTEQVAALTEPREVWLERLIWCHAAVCVGIARTAQRVALEYATEREQFGKPIARFQAIQWMLADNACEIDAAAEAVACANESGEPLSLTSPAMFAYRLATHAATTVADRSLQVHGGYGFTEEFACERLLRAGQMLATECERFSQTLTLGA